MICFIERWCLVKWWSGANEYMIDIGTAVNALLRLSLEDSSLEELLQKALDIILSVPSLSIETKGSILIVEDEPEVLIQKVQKGLAEPLLKECARVPFGKCLCGRAAAIKRIEFADHIDERHEVRYEGMAPHGHYCVPILLSGNTIGVINLYLKDGHSRVGREEEFLDSVANTLAGIIKRKRAEEELKKRESLLQKIFDVLPVGLWFADKDGKLLRGNPAGVKIWGAEPKVGPSGYGVFKARRLPSREEIAPEDWALVHTVRKRITVVDEMLEIDTFDGKKKVILNYTAPVLDDQGAIQGAIVVNLDITSRREAEEQLQHTLDSLRKAFGTTVQVMVSAVESRDPYTAGHQNRSADLARAIATEMGLSQERIDGIRIAGTIHDIGKLSVPAEILSKPTKLTNIEFSLIKEHARKGYEMLKDVESPWPLAEIAYQHHERMDGSGYPRNLKGDYILMEARIMAVADVVESMASHRPYRPALGLNAALEEIENNKGTLYDADAVDACLKLFREKGFQLEGIRF
jgi:PAS domain S-box-containing protein